MSVVCGTVVIVLYVWSSEAYNMKLGARSSVTCHCHTGVTTPVAGRKSPDFGLSLRGGAVTLGHSSLLQESAESI